MIRSLIIEDELKGRKVLSNYLKKFMPEIEIIDFAVDVSQGVNKIITLRPDLVFLDISLPDGTGFDILEKVAHIDFELIFVTAYNQYTLDAIKKSNCCDYLIKPISIEDLQVAVEKAKINISKKSANKISKLSIPTLKQNIVIEIEDIIYCQADRSWTTVFLKDGSEIVSSKNLSKFENILQAQNFLRIHRSFLVNLGEVKSYIRKKGGKVMMSNNNEIEISDAKRAIFIDKLNPI